MLINLIKMMRPGNGAKKAFLFFAVFALAVAVLGEDFVFRSDLPAPETAGGSALTQAAEDTPPALHLDGNPQAVMEAGLTGAAFADKAEPVFRNVGSKDAFGAEAAKAETAKAETLAFAKPLPEDKQLFDVTALPAKEGGFVYSAEIPMSYELQEYTYQKCVERGLEYELVLAVIWRESRFTADAVNQNANGTQDNGIMQINDVNKEWLLDKYGIDDLMDPYQNIDAGTAMLGDLTAKYGPHGAMLAYQYGETGMVKKLKDGHTTSSLVELAYRQRDYYRKIV